MAVINRIIVDIETDPAKPGSEPEMTVRSIHPETDERIVSLLGWAIKLIAAKHEDDEAFNRNNINEILDDLGVDPLPEPRPLSALHDLLTRGIRPEYMECAPLDHPRDYIPTQPRYGMCPGTTLEGIQEANRLVQLWMAGKADLSSAQAEDGTWLFKITPHEEE